MDEIEFPEKTKNMIISSIFICLTYSIEIRENK